MATLDLTPYNPGSPLSPLRRISQAELSPIEAGPSLVKLAKILRRQKWLIVNLTVLLLAAAVALTFTLPKTYEATATVKVDRHSAGGVVGQDSSQNVIDDMDQIINTELELAVSDPVLRPTVEKYHLLELEHQLKRFLLFDVSPEEARLKRAAPIELKHLKIKRPPNTFLINISYRANDRQLAADVANSIANSLIAHANDTGKRSYAQVSASIASDLKDMRMEMNDSSRRLAQFEKDLNMMDPEQRTTVVLARLSQLNTEYTAAQAERLHTEAILEAVAKSRNLAAAQAAEAQGHSTLLDDTLERLDTARQQFAAARSYYGENHPEYRKAQQQVVELEGQLQRLEVGLGDKTAAEYAQAVGRELRLHRLLDQTKAEADSLREHQIHYEELKSEAENAKKLYGDLETRAREAEIGNQLRDATIQIATTARPQNQAVSPRLIINIPVSLVLAIILGVFSALLRDAMDTTFADAEDAANRLHLDVLAAIPGARRLAQLQAPNEFLQAHSPSARRGSAEIIERYGQAIRALRNALATAALEQPLRTVLMTSPGAHEGKSTTAISLALASAQIGKKVLLIDADLRRPSLHRHFHVSSETGLSGVLAQKATLDEALIKIENVDLHLLPAGRVSGHASDLISMGFAAVLNAVSPDYDLVIVDGPPMLAVAETQEMARLVDGVLLLTKAGFTTGRAVADTVTSLLRVRARILGVVMNQVKLSDSYGPYYYSTLPESDQLKTKSARA